MPSKPPNPSPNVSEKLLALGQQIRIQRKSLKLSASVVAEAAGMSRVTLHRIEKGEPSVTMGAYLSVMDVLGSHLRMIPIHANQDHSAQSDENSWLPPKVHLEDYPQLKQLAWHVSGSDVLTPREALDIYERNWRHLEENQLGQDEITFIDHLRTVYASRTS